jgi:60 kDa SS-A/Ro ribonucleoprotein
MSSSYLTRAASPLQTPQSEPIPGSAQVANNAGGFAWKIGTMDRLRRFLVLGSEGGTYYVGERKLTRENIDGIRAALDEHKTEAVAEIVAISKDGRAPKNDPALYALAIACAHPDKTVRRAATKAIPDVARTGTHLFHFAEFVQSQRGWGPALKKGVAAWYEREDVDRLAYQLVKYRQRDGWTHRDLLRLAHPKADTSNHRLLYDWACGRGLPKESVPAGPWFDPTERPLHHIAPIAAFEDAQRAGSPAETAALVRKWGGKLPREALNTEHLKSIEVWTALLDAGMPMTALIRNLATMTRLGVLKPMGTQTQTVVEQLQNAEAIKKARVHPMSVLIALATYATGASWRGSTGWEPLREIIDAMDGAFYAAFGNVEPTGKRHVLALDCSHSMDTQMSGTPLTCMQGAAAMALITDRVEARTVVTAFHGEYTPCSISNRQRLDDVLRSLPRSVGMTDCAVPMLWAMQNDIEADVFAIYTDNETWYGQIHPAQALEAYRRKTGIDARLVVVSMTATPFSIADPNDRGMLDVVGFDTAAPQVIADFTAGRF